ncbi:MAG: hypothetical protein FWF77_05585 [Defluviitaleaceae bacterium]|nr:hypothetical protein [Defluviitaleaceae bacterium]
MTHKKARQARSGHRVHVSESAHSLEAGSSFPTHKKNARRQIVLVFVSMIGVMIIGMALGARRIDMSEWAEFEFTENAEDIFFEIEPGENEIHAILINDGDVEIMFGYDFRLAKLSGGAWRVFPFADVFAVNDLGLVLPPGYRAENLFVLRESMFTARFTPGTYRIATTVWDGENSLQVWGEFELLPRD